MHQVTHQTSYRVRYSDTDKMGVVYYGNYMRLFEIGRTELLRSAGLPYVEFEREGLLLPVLEAHCEYLLPARYDEMLVIETNYQMEHSPVILLQYEVRRTSEALARGWTRHSFVAALDFKPVRPPRRFFDVMASFTSPVNS